VSAPSKRGPTRDNLLMKAMGADPPYRFDPEPPDQYHWVFNHATTSREVLKAWVKMNTVALGRHSPFCIDEHGRILGILDLMAATGWGRKYAEEVLRDAEKDGIIRRDPEIRSVGNGTHNAKVRRIWLCAKIKDAYARNATGDSKGVDGSSTTS